MVFVVSQAPIDPAAVYGMIGKDKAGSVVFHFAVVKKQKGESGSTIRIEYGANGDTEGELKKITDELKQKWVIEDLVLIRRVGLLEIGDIISLVAVSSPNSEDAFASCKHGISLLKKMATISKKETFA